MNQNVLVISGVGLWLVVKLTLLKTGHAIEGHNVSVMLNMLLMLAVIFIGLYQYFRSEERGEGNFVDDFKEALKIGGKYLLLVSGAIAIYYNYIDDSIIASKRYAAIELAEKTVADEATWSQFKEQNPDLAGKTKEEYVANVKQGQNQIMTTGNFILFSVMGSMMLAILYSISCVVLFRNLLFKQVKQ